MDAEQAYDALPYDSKPFAESHPDRLCVVGRLLGLDPPPVQTARILELGCAEGGNLLPMAVRLPDSQCVGVDLSGVQIREGQELAHAVGVNNCRLIHGDLATLGDLGEFDYVIAHGVWSWVPAAIQDAILERIRTALAPSGLAYVSYNTYPGWFRRGMIREMCRWHIRDLEDTSERVDQARTLVAFLLSTLSEDTGAHAQAIREEAGVLQHTDATYMTHGLLADVNTPCWYHEMATRVREASLQIIGDAGLEVLLHQELTPKAQQSLRQLPLGSDRYEQLADLIENRTFRRSILAHSHVKPTRPISWSAVTGLHVSSLAKRVPGDVPRFALFGGGHFSVRNPLLAGAMQHLVDMRPRTVHFDALLTHARNDAGLNPTDDDVPFLAQSLLTMMAKRAVTLVPRDLGIAAPGGTRPVACPLVRERARRGRPVPSLRHVNYLLRSMDQHLVQLLDGTADMTTLLARLEQLHAAGTLRVETARGPIFDPAEFREACRQGLPDWLDGMARAGFLLR